MNRNRKDSPDTASGIRVYRYRTEPGFHRAFARFNMFGAVADWFGTDHEWLIRVRVDKLPERGQS